MFHNIAVVKADRRAHHNSLERKRREHIKSSFNGLRDAIPSMVGEKVSRSQILRKAGEYIQSIKRKTSALNDEVEELRRQNALLDQQIKQLERSGPHQEGTTALPTTSQRLQSVTLQPLQQSQSSLPSGSVLVSNGHVLRVASSATISGILEGHGEPQIIMNSGHHDTFMAKKPKLVSYVGKPRGGV